MNGDASESSRHRASPLSLLDRPNSYIGRSVARPNARRLLAGQGQFIGDITLPRMLHVAFYRSPYAHARIERVETVAAAASADVVRVVTGADIIGICKPWIGVLDHLKGLKSAPQPALAVDRVLAQGEPIVAVVARSQAAAEDAAQKVSVDFTPLPPLIDAEAALADDAPVLHPELGDNLTFERSIEVGDVEQAFGDAAVVVEDTFDFARQTGVTLEARGVIADYRGTEGRLILYQSSQAPHMMRSLLARQFGIAESDIRVVAPDIGGSFGIKIHCYPDEMATVALAILLKRPVKFIADRLESFISDIHARGHRVRGRMAVNAEGRILAFAADSVTGVGPYSAYPRTSAVEANQVINLIGGPYDFPSYRARARVAFQNKVVMSQYRAVGHPIACTVTEALIDQAAAALDLDPAEMRRRNLIDDDAYPAVSTTGLKFEGLSHHRALKKMLAMMNYDALRAEQTALRAKGVHRGIGLASFIEITNPSPAFYGVGGAPIAAQDGCAIRLDPEGGLALQVSVGEQGQGTETVLAQIAASVFEIPLAKVRVVTGDTETTPEGGDNWASRAAGIAGEATLQAAKALRANVVEIAGALLQTPSGHLDVRDGKVIEVANGAARFDLAEIARTVYFRTDTLPEGVNPELMVTRHYVPRAYPFAFTNGVQASHVEVDAGTGRVTLLKHWVVEDCGTVINPLLVAEQLRGGIVQGIGGALYEECLYDEQGQMRNANMADYLVPMAAEMPDIEIGHVRGTPTAESELGAKGTGEAGVAGAPAAVLNAVNDALKPFAARVTSQPITPERILRALGKLT